MLTRRQMVREQIASLLPFFAPREVPSRAPTPDDALVIHSAMQRVDSAYERFRNLLDPGDEDILRRKAIVRFLGRRWELASKADVFALALLKDLAYGRYIPNDTDRRLAERIAIIVEKSHALWILHDRTSHPWLFPLLAVDIDRVLYPREADDALVYQFFEDVRAQMTWEEDSIPEHERMTHLFLACHRSLAKTDDAELFWHLFRTAEPAWMVEHPEQTELEHIAAFFPQLAEEIERALRHPIALRLLRLLQPRAVPYRVLREVLRRGDAARVLEHPNELAAAVTTVLEDRVRRLERQMFRRVWHAAIFLFLSKGVLALALEIPYEVLVDRVRVIPLVINVVFPVTLLLLMTGSVPRPGRENTQRLISSIQGIVTGEHLQPFGVRAPQRHPVRGSIFALFYGIVTLTLIAGIFGGLRWLNFSLVGGFFFVIFLGLVSFLGLRLRSSMGDLRVIAPRTGILAALADFFFVPIVDLGRQIALRASQVNVFLFLLDAVIEAPFKVLLGIVEEWFAYLREKKEEFV